MTVWMKSMAFGVAGSLGVAASAQTTLISDDFETDTSADYTLVDESNGASGDGTPDSVATFAFDYITAGLPLAPNSTAGDTGGLFFAANETGNDAGAADHITAFHNTAVTSPFFTLTVDVYLSVDNSAGGTTEYAHVGVASDPSDFLSIFTPVVFNGHTLAFTGDGGSASDFRHSDNDEIFNTGDPTYLDPASTTNGTGALYQGLFPTGDPRAGSPGNLWTTLEVVSNGSTLTYSFDGTPIIETAFDGTGDQIALGYADVFSSVGPHFVVFDNLTVTDVPEPATAALLGLGGLAMLRRRSA